MKIKMETIGMAVKNPEEPLEFGEGVRFEIPYGRERYGIMLSHTEMDQLLDKKYAEIMGRTSLIGSGFTIDLELPDLPLFAHAAQLNIEQTPGYPPHISMGVGIATMSHVYEHRGLLLASRHEERGSGVWEYVRYETGEPLKSLEEEIESKIAVRTPEAA